MYVITASLVQCKLLNKKCVPNDKWWGGEREGKREREGERGGKRERGEGRGREGEGREGCVYTLHNVLTTQ